MMVEDPFIRFLLESAPDDRSTFYPCLPSLPAETEGYKSVAKLVYSEHVLSTPVLARILHKICLLARVNLTGI